MHLWTQLTPAEWEAAQPVIEWELARRTKLADEATRLFMRLYQAKHIRQSFPAWRRMVRRWDAVNEYREQWFEQ